MSQQNGTRVYTIRFLPGQELKTSIEDFVESKKLKAAFIITCVGSLRKVTLRFATPAGGNGTFNERLVSVEMTNGVQVFTLCLQSGEDLKERLEEFAVEKNIKASFVLTCVGTLNSATLSLNSTPSLGPPFPSFEKVESYDKENFEICSLVGTVSPEGSHLHCVLARADGSVLAGHLVGNAEVQTTAEVVLGESLAETYTRVYDKVTCYNELKVERHQ